MARLSFPSRSPFVLGLTLVVAAALSACGSSSTCAPAERPLPVAVNRCERGRTFVILRHAEKASATEKDPSLSDKGRARAETVAAMLAHANVTRLVATPYRRTQETLAPLAARLGLAVETRPADKTADLVRELLAVPDGTVTVVASHSNVVPTLVRELGHAELHRLTSDGMLPEDDFGRVIVLGEGCGTARASLVELSSDR